jgi:hypothetical protein
VAVPGKAEEASGGIQAMLEALEAWQEKADALVTTGAFDDEVIATHDSKGCLIELWVRPGLQQELTTDELEDRMNEAISDNAHRARAALMELSDRFLGRFRSIPEEYLHHPTAEQLAGVYSSAREPETSEESK